MVRPVVEALVKNVVDAVTNPFAPMLNQTAPDDEDTVKRLLVRPAKPLIAN